MTKILAMAINFGPVFSKKARAKVSSSVYKGDG